MNGLRGKILLLTCFLIFLSARSYTMMNESQESVVPLKTSATQRSVIPSDQKHRELAERGELFVREVNNGKIKYGSFKELQFFMSYIRKNLCLPDRNYYCYDTPNPSRYFRFTDTQDTDRTRYWAAMFRLYDNGLWHPQPSNLFTNPSDPTASVSEGKLIQDSLFRFRGGGGLLYPGWSAHPMPRFKSHLDDKIEKIAVIGGGYTGVMSAILLASLKDDDDTPLYKVHLFEAKKELMTGASLAPGRLHLGGEYPKDESTAIQCLKSAILFRQMFRGVYTDIPATAYLLSRHSEEELSYEKMKEQYEKIRQQYVISYKKLKNKYGDETDSLFFGRPERLYTEISEEELPEGYRGILTQEKGFNPLYLGLTLEKLLAKFEVTLRIDKEISQDVYQPYDFSDNGHFPGYVIENEYYHQVVNATWVDYLPLEILLSPKKDRSIRSTSFVRAIMLADISECKIPVYSGQRAANFGLLGEHGGMASPFNEHIALLYLPNADGSYIGEHPVNLSVPNPIRSFPKRKELYDIQKNKRMDNILQNLTTKYPFLEGAKPIDLIIRETLSFDEEDLERRRHLRAARGEVAVGQTSTYIRAQSTKATYCPVTALEVVRLVLDISSEKNPHRQNKSHPLREWLEDCFEQNEKGLVLPEQFCFPSYQDEEGFFTEAEEYAERHGLQKKLALNDRYTYQSVSKITSASIISSNLKSQEL